jgi:hypothetical protein
MPKIFQPEAIVSRLREGSCRHLQELKKARRIPPVSGTAVATYSGALPRAGRHFIHSLPQRKREKEPANLL